MTSSTLGRDSAPVTHLNSSTPAPAVMRTLSRYKRPQLEGFIEIAINLLDFVDGDPDREDDDPREDDGDAQDGNFAEDDFARFNTLGLWEHGPGCPISDPGGCQHNDLEPDEGL